MGPVLSGGSGGGGGNVDLSAYATLQNLTDAIDALRGISPEELDTLQEIAARVVENGDDVASISSQIAGKQDASARLSAIAALVTGQEALLLSQGENGADKIEINSFMRDFLASVTPNHMAQNVGIKPRLLGSLYRDATISAGQNIIISPIATMENTVVDGSMSFNTSFLSISADGTYRIRFAIGANPAQVGGIIQTTSNVALHQGYVNEPIVVKLEAGTVIRFLAQNLTGSTVGIFGSLNGSYVPNVNKAVTHIEIEKLGG